MFAPFLVGFALCISDGNADLPQHLLVDLADRCSQRPDGGRGVEIKDRHEIFVVEVAFRLQSAAGHQSVSDADGGGCLELHSDVMLVVQDQVWNRVTINRAAHKSTRYYIDEMHLLLKEEQTAAYTVEIWKRFRKWGGIPTGITQNVKDLLSSREVENIFENSDFVYMLNQAQGDREILAKQLNISQQQMTYVTHSDAGEGLIFYGNVILPFIDRFPQDTELYRVMTTKPGEVSA